MGTQKNIIRINFIRANVNCVKRNSIINKNSELAQKECNKYDCMGKGYLPGTVQRMKFLFANQSYLLKAE